jgi:hypothetical protein
MALAALFEADDAVHDCLIQALSNWQQFRPGTNLRAWLMTLEERDAELVEPAVEVIGDVAHACAGPPGPGSPES